MCNIKIMVDRPAKLGVVEDESNEFKTSIFYADGDVNPGSKQMCNIAKTIAGFINARGGTLWLGVRDDGTIRGVAKDLEALGSGIVPPVRGPTSNDVGFKYGWTLDKYELKLHAIVKAMLGASSEKYIMRVSQLKAGRIEYLKVDIAAAEPEYIAYFHQWISVQNRYTEVLCLRRGNHKDSLEGSDRDNFIRDRYKLLLQPDLTRLMAQNERLLERLDALGAQSAALSKEDILSALKVATTEARQKVRVTGAVSINDPLFKDVAIKGFVFNGEHVKDVKSVAEFVEEILKKIQSVNPAVFDALPDAKGFSNWFVRLAPGKRAPRGHYRVQLGSAGDIRAKEQPQKTYLIQDRFYLRKLIAQSGIQAEKFMARG